MLEIAVTTSTSFNEETNEFEEDFFMLQLEHSLVSLSKWEFKHEKPFLGKEEKSAQEILDYVKMMILTPVYPPDLIDQLSQENINQIQAYIDKAATASSVNDTNQPRPPQRETITSELIYYWITSYQIPWEVQFWHLNRLLMLIRIFNAKSTKPKKGSARESAAQRHALNQQRMRKYNTRG